MRIPDKLIIAAADPLCRHRREKPTHRQFFDYSEPCMNCRYEVSKVLAAAFAALPECEEVKVSPAVSAIYFAGWNDCLRYLARMGEDNG